jgi:FkbM family methyltransferase
MQAFFVPNPLFSIALSGRKTAARFPLRTISITYDDLTTSLVRDRSARDRNRKPVPDPMRTLSSVLTEAELQNIDFFSLDVEGFEVEVFLNWVTTRPDRPCVQLRPLRVISP